MNLIRRNNNVIFPSLMNELLKPDWFGGVANLNATVPAVNIKEHEKDFELAIIAPGRKKEDFKIEIDNELLTITSEIVVEENEEKDNYTRKEFEVNSFKRVFNLPETINSENIDATYVDGVLKLTLPKRAESLPKPKRFIELK